MKFNGKSLKLLSIISIIAINSITAGCDTKPIYSEVLLDEDGNSYRIKENSDGSESLQFLDEDGWVEDEVQIMRNEDNSIDYLSGNEDLILGALTGYFLYHGLSTTFSSINKDERRYVPATPVSVLNRETARSSLSSYQSNIKSGFGTAGVRSSSAS